MIRKVKNSKRLWMGLKKAPVDVNSVNIYFFHGKDFADHTVIKLNESVQVLNHDRFDPNMPTVLYLHGYIETMEVESAHVIADAYIKRGDHNILLLDWAQLADGNYLFDAVPNIKKLGPFIAEQLLEWTKHGFQLDKLHLVGHSLGGQLSGYVGRSIQSLTKGQSKLRRITALDPAFPPFYPAIGVKALSSKDADLVDVIHTDAWLYGAPFTTGTVDFWPNGGKTLQPGCPKRNYKMLTDNDLCSHRRSWRFWAESIAEKDTECFQSVKAASWDKFKQGSVDEKAPVIKMGIDCPLDARGDYYLQTGGDYPYSKGQQGLKYVSKRESKSTPAPTA